MLLKLFREMVATSSPERRDDVMGGGLLFAAAAVFVCEVDPGLCFRDRLCN